MPTLLVAHLLFFTTQRPTLKKIKIATKQHTMTESNARQTSTIEKEQRRHNI